jgi:hypothetical protein
MGSVRRASGHQLVAGVTQTSPRSGPTALSEPAWRWQNESMKSPRTRLSTLHFRGNRAHVALLNAVWDRTDLTRDRLPGASGSEQAAYAAAVRAALAVEGAVETDAVRVAALLVELARRYPAVVLYPGRLLEVAWPVLVQAQAQGMLPGVEGWSATRRLVGAAALAATAVLAGPRASWWQPYDGHWLWASTTRSQTTGLPTTQQHAAPLAG